MNKNHFNIVLKAIQNKLLEIMPTNSRAVLYGSRARGDAKDDSDWDIHILVPGNENLSLKEIGDYAFPLEMLGWEFNECFSVMVYSHEGWAKRRYFPYYQNVETDKIVLFNSTIV